MTERSQKLKTSNSPLPVDLSTCQVEPIGAKNQSWKVKTAEGKPMYVLKAVNSFTDSKVAECLMRIQHAGLPRCFGTAYIDDLQQDCYVFEYLPGKELKHFISAGNTEDFLLSIAIKICSLLVFLRCQPDFEIWHLDLKPQNIIVNDRSEPALIDFASSCMAGRYRCGNTGPSEGIAEGSVESSTDETADGSNIPIQFSCTPGFAAPEMLMGRPHRSSDLYSLAVTFLIVLSRNRQNDGKKISEITKSVRPELASTLADYLQSDPILRPQRPEQLASGLKQVSMMSDSEKSMVPAEHKDEFSEIEKTGDGLTKVETDAPGNSGNVDKTDISSQTSGGLRSSAPVICFWNSTEMACEAASYIAGCGRKVLLIDSEWLDSRTDLLLGIRNIARSDIKNALVGNLDNALSAAFDSQLDDSRLSDLVQTTQIDNLHLIAPSGNFEIYEDDLSLAFFRLIETAKSSFDIIIISAGSNFYDELACLSLSLSDHVISVIRGFNESIRAQGRAMTFLCHKKIIAENKISFAVFDYKIAFDLSRGTISQLCKHRLIGFITENQQRRKQKCSPLPYAARLSRQNIKEYKSMLDRLKLDKVVFSNEGVI